MKNTKTNNQNKSSSDKEDNKKHFPVLLKAVLDLLDPKEGDSYLDLTAGYGGHAVSVLERTLSPERTTLVDRDQNSIEYLESKFKGRGVQIIHQDFLSASQELAYRGNKYNLILADLGVSSPHLDIASRGFSLRSDGPLDMRMDQRQSLTAESIINTAEQSELVEILRTYGEEPRAMKIARLIIENRPITTTSELANIVTRAWPGHSKVHPATRTFQALRIAVNSELAQIQQAIPIWIDLLAPGGRIVVISFHSLEDRIVKEAFKDAAGNRYDARLQLLTKQPVTADSDESVFNPRARSAKLRAAVKIKNK